MGKVDDRIAPVDEVQLLRAAACDWRLSRGDLGTLAVILRHCNAEWVAFPGPKTIAEKARLAVTNVKACIRRLEKFRYIEIERRGLRKKNRYRILSSPTCPTRRAGIPRFKSATGRADIPSSENPSGYAGIHQTGHAGIQKLGMPARHEDAFKTPNKSQRFAPVFSDSENQDQEQQQKREQERLQEKAKQRDRVRAEYLETRFTHPEWARRMERTFPEELADLIEDKAA